MCQYQTYHWSCCPGTSRPVPYFMNSICPQAITPTYIGGKRKKCKIEFTALDGADYGEACPKCKKEPFPNDIENDNEDEDEDDDNDNEDGDNEDNEDNEDDRDNDDEDKDNEDRDNDDDDKGKDGENDKS